jgi:hypothetical protein
VTDEDRCARSVDSDAFFVFVVQIPDERKEFRYLLFVDSKTPDLCIPLIVVTVVSCRLPRR